MSAITEQVHQLHDEVAVLTKLRRATLAQAIFAQFANSKIQTVLIQAVSDDGHGYPGLLVSIVDDKLLPTDAAIDAMGYTYHRPFGQEAFDPTEHGNAGLKGFLEFGIEWNALMPIIDEINAWRDDIQAVFDLVPDGPSIHITCDQCWNAVVELKATEEAK